MRCKKCLTIFQGDVCPRCGLSVLKDADFRTQNSDIDELEAAFLDDFKDEIEENKKNKAQKKTDSADHLTAESSSDARLSEAEDSLPKDEKGTRAIPKSEDGISVTVKKKTKKSVGETAEKTAQNKYRSK